MRRHITFLLLCVLFIWGIQNALYSQSKEKPMLFWVQSERALPSKVFDYEGAQKNANEFIKKNLPTLQWYAYSSENDTYFYITPIESLSDLEKMEQTISEAIKKSGRDEMRKVNESFRDKVSSVETDIYVFDKDLSCVPKEPRVKPDEAGYERWVEFEFYPYYDREALSNCEKEMKEFFEKNDSSVGYDMFNKVLGGNSNISVMTRKGKNRVDFFTYQNEWNKKHWEDFKPLYIKFMSFVKDYKIMDVWFRKDLSILKEESK